MDKRFVDIGRSGDVRCARADFQAARRHGLLRRTTQQVQDRINSEGSKQGDSNYGEENALRPCQLPQGLIKN